MTLSTFFSSLLVLVLVFIAVRLLWELILIVGLIIYILGHLILWSFVSMLLWAGFVSQSSGGWGLLWLFFLILYSSILVLYALIALDILSMIGSAFRNFIKGTK